MTKPIQSKISVEHPIQAWLNYNGQNVMNMIPPSDNITPSRQVVQHNMCKSMKVLLHFGKIIGILPINGIFCNETAEGLVVRKGSIFTTLVHVFIVLILTLEFGLSIYGFLFGHVQGSPLAIAQSARPVIFTGAGLFMVVFLHKNAQVFIDCLRQWQETETIFQKADPHLPLVINAITVLILSSTIGENIIAHSNAIVVHTHHEGHSKSLLQTYWEVHYPETVNLISYNPVLSLILFIANKLTSYAWNFANVLIVGVATEIYRRFQLQNESMAEHLIKLGENADKAVWASFVQDREKLLALFKKFKIFLSPLIFVCIFSNVFFIAMHLSYFFISTKLYDLEYQEYQMWKEIYFIWGFIHIVVRLLLVCVCCGRVSKHVHDFVEVLDKCPSSCLSKEVERVEIKLRTETFGFSGLNLFTITNSFILQVLNVVFTLEIVLLQSNTEKKVEETLS